MRDTSRRTVLAGMALAPVAALPAVAGSTPVDRTAWTRVKKGFEAARAAEKAYDEAVWGPAFERWRGDENVIPDHVDAEMDRLQEARCDYEDVIIATPAPDLSQVIWKIDYARERWQYSVGWPDDWWAAVMADLHRLNGGAA